MQLCDLVCIVRYINKACLNIPQLQKYHNTCLFVHGLIYVHCKSHISYALSAILS